MKSTSRTTGRPGGLAISDGLSNVVTGMGTSNDRSFFNRWAIGGDAGNVLGLMSEAEIDAAYLTSGLVRKLHDLRPQEITKNWRTFSLDKDKTDLIKAEEKRLNVRWAVREAKRLAKLKGGCGLILGLPGDPRTPAPQNIGPKRLRYVMPMPRGVLSFDELNRDLKSPWFYQPKLYRMNSRDASVGMVEIHPSRVIPFFGAPSTGEGSTAPEGDVSLFWGHPLMQALATAVNNAVMGSTSIAALLPELATDVIHIPGLTDMVSTAEGEALLSRRLTIARLMASMFRVKVMDGGDGSEGSGEEWETRQLDTSGLPEVGMFLLNVLAGEADIPVTRLVGSPPKGMNATGEHDERNFTSSLKAEQDMDLRPALERLDLYLLPSAGVTDAGADFTFNPIEEPSPSDDADLDKTVAEAFKVIKDTGLVQHDALANVLVAHFDGRTNFPGLAEAVTKSSEDIPAASEMMQAETMTTAKSRALLTPAGPKTAKKPTRDSLMIADARPLSLYISRRVLNPQEVLSHYRKQGLGDILVAPASLHVTVIYHEGEVDWMKVPQAFSWDLDEDGKIRLPPGGVRVMDLFGPLQDVLVLGFRASALEYRVEQLKEAGIESKWPDYQPHVTIAKVTPGFDLSKVEPYRGRLVLGPEIFEEIV